MKMGARAIRIYNELIREVEDTEPNVTFTTKEQALFRVLARELACLEEIEEKYNVKQLLTAVYNGNKMEE
jgi:hypothetical protein